MTVCAAHVRFWGQSGHRGWQCAKFANRNGRPDVTRVTYNFSISGT